MAISPVAAYPANVNAASTAYPYGQARNITTPSDGTGTPWEALLINDIFGYQQAMLSLANITPSGSADTATTSQYLQAARTIHGSTVNGVSKLLNVVLDTAQLKNGQAFTVLSYHGDSDYVFAKYIYNTNTPRNTHNGGSIISPTATFPSDWNDEGQKAAWFDGSLLVGTGCFVLQYDEFINAKCFGAKGDATTIEDKALQACLNAGHTFVPRGTYLVIGSIFHNANYRVIKGAGMGVTILAATANRRGQTFQAVDKIGIVIADMTLDADNGSIEGQHLWSGVVEGLIQNVEFLNGDLTSMNFAGNSGFLPSTQTGRDCKAINCVARGQKRYVPGGTSPFIAGDGAIDCLFLNCLVEDCEADAYDSDNSYNTRFVNCEAKSTGAAIGYYAFWSEGQEDLNGYTVTWDKCKSKGYLGGFGITEEVRGNIINCIVEGAGDAASRAIWAHNDYTHNVVNFTCRACTSGASATNGIVLLEGGATINGAKFLEAVAGSNLIISYAGASAIEVPITLSGITTEFCDECRISFGNAQTGSRKITLKDSHLIDSGLFWFDTTNKVYRVENVVFEITEGNEAFSPISGARAKEAIFDSCKFIKQGTQATSIVFNITIDNFNTYIKNCEFDNFTTVTNNGTLMEGNVYSNMVNTPTAWLNPFLKRGYAEVTVTVGGTYYPIPGTSDVGAFNLRIKSLTSSDHAVANFVSVRNSPGAVVGAFNELVALPDFGTGDKYALQSLVGEAEINITHPTAGRIAAITFDYV